MAEIAPDVVVHRVRTMADVALTSIAPQRFNALLLAVFAFLAIFLAAVGIYGVLAFAVGQRTRELGIRVALGARPADLVRMVVRRGLALAVAGVALGAAGALALSRFLESLLFAVRPGDPEVFAGVASLVVAVALAASYLPARRAGLVDPVRALRGE